MKTPSNFLIFVVSVLMKVPPPFKKKVLFVIPEEKGHNVIISLLNFVTVSCNYF